MCVCVEDGYLEFFFSLFFERVEFLDDFTCKELLFFFVQVD